MLHFHYLIVFLVLFLSGDIPLFSDAPPKATGDVIQNVERKSTPLPNQLESFAFQDQSPEKSPLLLPLADSAGTDATVPAVSEMPNLLLNPSMELGEGAPTAWQQGAPVEGVEFTWDRNQGAEGKACLALSKTAKRYFPITEWYQVLDWKSDASTLNVSAKVKAEDLTKAVLDVAFLDENGKWKEHKWVSYIGEMDDGPPVTHDWKEYQGQVTVPTGTKKLQIGLQIYGPGNVWFDDVRVTAVAVAIDDLQAIVNPAEAKSEPRTEPMVLGETSRDRLLSHSKLSISSSPDRATSIVALTRAEYQKLGDELSVSADQVGENLSVITVNGPTVSLVEVGAFIRGLERQHQKQFSLKRKPDETDLKLDQETRKLAGQVRAATDTEQKPLVQELNRLVGLQFNHRQDRRKQEIDELANRIEQMRITYNRRRENQAEIIRNRVKELLEEDRDLKWDEAQQGARSNPDLAANEATESSKKLLGRSKARLDAFDPNVTVGTTHQGSIDVEPTFDGITYSAWLRTLETDRSPRKVREAMQALKQMLTEPDALRLAESFFRAVRPLPEGDHPAGLGLGISRLDHDTKMELVLANLNDLPAEAVFEAMIQEIRDGGLKHVDTQALVIQIVRQAIAGKNDQRDPNQPFAQLKYLLSQRGKELLSAFVEAAPDPFDKMLSPTMNILYEWQLKPDQITGLTPLIEKTLNQIQMFSNDQWITFILLFGRIDPNFSIVQQALPELIQTLQKKWDTILQLPYERNTELYVGAAGPAGIAKMYPQQYYEVTRLISGLGQIGPSAKAAIPLLKEIGSTDLSQTEFFKAAPVEIRDDLKQFIENATTQIERRVK